MHLGLVVTSRCNAKCAHCSTSCGPDKSQKLSNEKILSLMQEAAAIKDGADLAFCITGGEPFLNYPELLEIIGYGARLGGRVSCVTNGYWAASPAKARAKLTPLKEAGLTALAVSTSRFHAQFIKREKIEIALQTAKDLGVYTVLKCPLTRSDCKGADSLEAWAKSCPADEREIFPVVPYLREGETLPKAEYLHGVRLPAEKCPVPILTVREDGVAYTCCTPGGFSSFLALGNLHEYSLAQTHRLFHLQGKQRILRHHGPAYFARAAIAQGHGNRLRKSYAHVCDLCAHVTSDPILSADAEQAAERYEKSFVRKLFRKMMEEAPHP